MIVYDDIVCIILVTTSDNSNSVETVLILNGDSTKTKITWFPGTYIKYTYHICIKRSTLSVPSSKQ